MDDEYPQNTQAGKTHRPTVSEIMTQLPLPGEYVVLQLNPAAMAKHVGDPKLLKKLSQLKTDKYLAVCGGVRLAPHVLQQQSSYCH
jgi:hypothetical protein